MGHSQKLLVSNGKCLIVGDKHREYTSYLASWVITRDVNSQWYRVP